MIICACTYAHVHALTLWCIPSPVPLASHLSAALAFSAEAGTGLQPQPHGAGLQPSRMALQVLSEALTFRLGGAGVCGDALLCPECACVHAWACTARAECASPSLLLLCHTVWRFCTDEGGRVRFGGSCAACEEVVLCMTVV